MEHSKRSFKEQRIREITLMYYSMPEIRKTILQFSQNRECIPQYYEGFGKRPDNFQYESDILEQVRKGATSFHCSEELWKDPLEISTELSEQEFNELRIGWDLLLDIDSPYLEYSKIYAQLLINILKFHGIENIGIKYSGNKGFHVVIPWKAFPKEIYNQQTKNMFPEWPRAICEYLSDTIKPKLAEKILQDENLKQLSEKTGKKEQELIMRKCISCKRPAEKKFLITWVCPYCKNEIANQEGSFNNRRKSKCPDCRKDLFEKSRQEIYFCNFCNKNSKKNPENFELEKFATEKLIEADLILVSPRHLFRMPYSLHEKTALASIVLDKDKIKDFQITDAKPFKFKPKNFYPDAEENEAKELLLQALDYKEQKNKSKEYLKFSASSDMQSSIDKKSYRDIEIKNLTEDLFPPCVKLILKGIKQDGRKRALFVLMNFFKSLKISDEEIEDKIKQWNEKNCRPLKHGYIQSQFNWYKKSQTRLPPNCDKPNYKDLAVCKPDEFCRQIKNPVNYVMKKYFRKRGK